MKKLLLTFLLLFSAASIARQPDVFTLSLYELTQMAVSTSSIIDEPVTESVVPMTIISADTIKKSGAQTLKDLLLLYVPGMTNVQDQNEVNVAMRGVFTSSQQKILFLLDGHRLNSHVYSMAAPDFSIGLNHIKQIEIMRGPGSSVYGDVALTAVVNIILKSGKTHSGTSASVMLGNFEQQKFNLEHGQNWDDSQLFAWLQLYKNQGEAFTTKPEFAYNREPLTAPVTGYVNGFNQKPAFDAGIKWQNPTWQAMVNHSRSHYIEPFSTGQISGEAYNYSNYDKLDGISPGLQTTNWHFNLRNHRQISPSTIWENEITFDRMQLKSPLVTNPAANTFGIAEFSDRAHGFKSQLLHQDDKHQWILGYQYKQFELDHSRFLIGQNNRVNGEIQFGGQPLVQPGKENSHALFAMYKYKFSDNLLANFGFRYDQKERLTLSTKKNISPRLGLVYEYNPSFQLKLSYAESFVDPTYWNRYGALPSFRGAVDLKPEKLRSFQLTPNMLLFDNQLNYQLNFFYNEVDDFIFQNLQASAEDPIFNNAGNLNTFGHEHELAYLQKNWSLKLVALFQRVTSFQRFNARDDYIYNIPNHTVNLIWDKQWPLNIRSQLSLQYVGKRLSPINIQADGMMIADPFPNAGVSFVNLDNELDADLLLSASLLLPLTNEFTLQLSVNNATDHTYYQGGTTTHPYRQPGRWWQLTLSKNF